MREVPFGDLQIISLFLSFIMISISCFFSTLAVSADIDQNYFLTCISGVDQNKSILRGKPSKRGGGY